jgi:histidinol-phosphate/aromatic aminotransferase/cobyric acid decarboxylase-like protein
VCGALGASGSHALCVPRQILNAVTSSAKLIFITSPPEPDGEPIPSDVIEAICFGAPDSLVVVDEMMKAQGSGVIGSACSLLHRHPNLVVLQLLQDTFR